MKMSTTRQILTAAGFAVALAAAPTGLLRAQVSPQTAASGVAADSAIVRQMVTSNNTEVQLGQLAQQKSANASVKQFAQQMVTDHTNMARQWTALAIQGNVRMPATTDPAQAQQASALGALSGADFDRAYMNAMVQAHQNAVSLLQNAGQLAHSAAVRQLATTGLATVKQHLATAQQLQGQVGNPTVATTTPTTTAPAPAPAPVPTTTTPPVGTPPTAPAPVPTTTTPPTAPPTNPPAAPAPSPTASSTTNPTNARNAPADLRADRDIVNELGADNMLEIRLAELAQRKANDQAVKQFAQRAANEFNRWQNQWSNMASRNSLPFQPGMGPNHRDKLQRVQQAKDKQFDRVYMRTVIDHLQSIVPYLQNEGHGARSSQVRNLADNQLPAVRQLLSDAQRIGRQVNVADNDNNKKKQK
jgi:putative membrane protein